MSRRRLAWSALVSTSVLLLLEGGARLLPERLNGRLELVQSLDGHQSMLASEEVPGWDISPPTETMHGMGPFAVNRWRMRGPDYPGGRSAGVTRIILVGDSAIMGFLLEWEETMGARLEELREARFPGVDYQVACCAVPGHSTVQSIAKLEHHCLDFEPDVVIIGNLNSDSTRWTMSDRERFQVSRSALATRTLRHSALYRTLRNLWLERLVTRHNEAPLYIPTAGSASAESDVATRVPPEEYRENLRTLIRMTRKAGALPVLLIPPNHARGMGQAPPGGWPPFWDIMREVAAKEEVLLADGDRLFQQLRQTEGLYLSPVHPSAKGARQLGDLLDLTLGDSPP